MKMKKMRTLDTRSINTFSTRIRMLKGAKASFLSLFLCKQIFSILIDYKIILNLIFTMEKLIVMKEINIDNVLFVINSSMWMFLDFKTLRMSGRL